MLATGAQINLRFQCSLTESLDTKNYIDEHRSIYLTSQMRRKKQLFLFRSEHKDIFLHCGFIRTVVLVGFGTRRIVTTMWFTLSVRLSFSVSVCVSVLSLYLSLSLLLNHWEKITTLALWLPLVVSVCENSNFSSVHPSVCPAIKNISTERGDFAMACHRLRM